MTVFMVFACLAVVLANVQIAFSASPNIPTGEKEPIFWNKKAKEYIDRRFRYKDNNKIAKNVILFIGDGMGPSTVTAARILRGQINNRPGEETILNFENFPNIALSKTYNVDRQTPESAGTATAMLSGVKTNYFLVGLDARATRDDCPGSKGKEVTTMVDWANKLGKSTGIVTTARITHATPAAAYAHSPNRYWEGDVNTENVQGGCRDIAQQLVDDNNNITVLFGGGRRYFLPNTKKDPETNVIDKNHRKDGRDLTQDWVDDKKERGLSHKYVWNKDQFDAIDPDLTDYAFGLFEPNYMQYELERDKSGATGEPSLAEMTRKAIWMLKKNDGGFFLLVEGARIDHAHHDSKPKKALYETLAMEDAVQVALELTNSDDTLIIVTGDHSSPMTIAGYAYRGTDMFGLVQPVEPIEDTLDDKPYSVLIYANGPGYSEPRTNLIDADRHGDNYIYPSGVPMTWSTHSGEDVAIYALGPMAHLFHGVHEQNYIGHVMAYSACIGPYFGKCDRPDSMETNSGQIIGVSFLLLSFISVAIAANTNMFVLCL